MKEKLKNNKILKFLEKHEYGVFLCIVILVCAIYYLSYTIHNIPYTYGWGNSYADLIFAGEFPYRDFYYYLPPLNLIIDCVLWELSFGHLFIYVIYRFIERLFIIFLAYKILCKLSKPRYVSIGIILGSIIFSATVYDLIGDYNQTALLLNLILTRIYMKYIEIANNSTQPKTEYKYLLLGGIIIGLSFLHKQTIFLAECIIFFIILTVYFIINHKKDYIKSILVTLLGIIIPIGITSIFFAINGAFVPFIDQVYLNVDSKGSILSIVSSLVVACFKWKYLILSTALALFLYFLKRTATVQEKEEKIYKNIVKLIFLIIILMIILFLFIKNIYNLELFLPRELGTIVIVSILLLLLMDFIIEKFLQKDSFILYFLLVTILLVSMTFLYFNTKFAYIIYRFSNAFYLLTDFTAIITIGSIILISYLFYSYYKNKDTTTLKWIIALAGGLAFEYSTAMATVNQVNNYGLMLLLAVELIFILTKVCNTEKLVKYIIFIICIMVSTICMSQKIVSAYEWWGWSDEMISSSKFNTIDVPGLEGFRVSKNVKKMYEEMYKVIKTNTNEDSVIYGFPHIRIFNVLLQNINMKHFVPVPFYDVSADEYIKKDIEVLKENPPEIVIWVDIRNCFEEHEKIFRNGKKLEQRKFQEWFSEAVNNGKYTLIGQYDLLFVYKLNDGDEIKYTYYKNTNAINKTLKQSN